MASFGEKLGGIVTSSFVGYALSMCKETGILQVLIESRTPLTSQEVADSKELKERYVRELLNCLATAELVNVSTNEAGALVYHIQEEEKKVFKTPLMPFMSFLSAFRRVYDTVKDCIPVSGPYGARYSEEVHNVIEEFSVCHQELFVDGFLNRVEGLRERLESGIEVIEVGCGRGRLLAMFAQMFPKSTFVASDNVPSLLARLEDTLGHIPNIRFELLDLCCQSDQSVKQYDWVYCVDVIHDLPNPPEALEAIKKLVKNYDGLFTIIDILTSGSPISDKGNMHVASIYAASSFMCVPESFQRKESYALGACWGKRTALDVITAAGFKVKDIDLENNFVLYICKL
ncbi:unnamed protein product [Candidula unifasciata]|uniref:Methyltransferase domain-containing protein n=1 Tax=Candidula unifasciata TaxID=100452 RepID=A0A8S3YZQ3_9EUPU|nr:unnamed protein product [Candidula unifasciata]